MQTLPQEIEFILLLVDLVCSMLSSVKVPKAKTKSHSPQTSRESKVFLCLLSINNSVCFFITEFVACAKIIIKERKRRKAK